MARELFVPLLVFAFFFAGIAISILGTVHAVSLSSTESAELRRLMSPRSQRNQNASVHQEGGAWWLGSDVDESIRLTERYDLFVYGDTLVGKWNHTTGARVLYPYMPHSSIGLWDRKEDKMSWYWGENFASLLQPPWASKDNIYWASTLTPVVSVVWPSGNQTQTFCVLGEQVLSGPDGGTFGFFINGSWVVCLDVKTKEGIDDGELEDPRLWPQRWSHVPHTGWVYDGGNISMNWRQASYVKEEDRAGCETVYLNGTENPSNCLLYVFGDYTVKGSASAQLLTRIDWEDLLSFNFGKTEVYCPLAGKYQPIQLFENSSSIVKELFLPYAIWMFDIPEFTVQWSPLLQQYFILHIDFMQYTIKMKAAAQLEGPWVDQGDVYTIPAPLNNKTDSFCYAVKAHQDFLKYTTNSSSSSSSKSMGNQEERWVYTYVCNGVNLGVVVEPKYANADIYVPLWNVLHIQM